MFWIKFKVIHTFLSIKAHIMVITSQGLHVRGTQGQNLHYTGRGLLNSESSPTAILMVSFKTVKFLLS